MPANKTSQATPVFDFLFFLSQVPGAPEFFCWAYLPHDKSPFLPASGDRLDGMWPREGCDLIECRPGPRRSPGHAGPGS